MQHLIDVCMHDFRWVRQDGGALELYGCAESATPKLYPDKTILPVSCAAHVVLHMLCCTCCVAHVVLHMLCSTCCAAHVVLHV